MKLRRQIAFWSGLRKFPEVAGTEKLNAQRLRTVWLAAMPANLCARAAVIVNALHSHNLTLGDGNAALDACAVLTHLEGVAFFDPIMPRDFIAKFQGNGNVPASAAAQVFHYVACGEKDVEQLSLLQTVQIGGGQAEGGSLVDNFRKRLDERRRRGRLPVLVLAELTRIFLQSLVAARNEMGAAQFVTFKRDTPSMTARCDGARNGEGSHDLDPPIAGCVPDCDPGAKGVPW